MCYEGFGFPSIYPTDTPWGTRVHRLLGRGGCVFSLFDLILFLIFSLVLASVFLVLPLLFSFFSTSPRKTTPLESGFVPLDESRSHFNNQFFIILVIFVIFDLEVVLSICVICLSLNSWFFWVLILFIGVTLLLEWWFNKIRWRD